MVAVAPVPTVVVAKKELVCPLSTGVPNEKVERLAQVAEVIDENVTR